MYNIIPLIVILVCLAVIVLIIVKKLSLLASFDVGEIPEQKEADTKEKIINERIERKAKYFFEKISPIVIVVKNFFQRKIKSIFDKVKEMEENNKDVTIKEELETKEEVNKFEKKIDDSLKKTEDLVEKEDYEEAEKKYLDIISRDSKNVEAYRGLGDLFLLKNEYEDAKQTFEHVLRIVTKEANESDNLAVHYYELAKANNYLEETEAAISNLEKALEYEPNNPKYLDLLLTISIINKDKSKAREILKKLKVVNPDNNKIEEFESQIDEL